MSQRLSTPLTPRRWQRGKLLGALGAIATLLASGCSNNGGGNTSLVSLAGVCEAKPIGAAAAFNPKDKTPLGTAFVIDHASETSAGEGPAQPAPDYVPNEAQSPRLGRTQLVACFERLPAEQIQICDTSGTSSSGAIVRYRAKALARLVEARSGRQLLSETIVAEAKDCPEAAPTKNDESSQLAEVYDGREELKEEARNWYKEMALGGDSPAAAARETQQTTQPVALKASDVVAQCEALNKPLRGDFFSAYELMSGSKAAVVRSWRGSYGIRADAAQGLAAIERTRQFTSTISEAMRKVATTDVRLQEYRDRYVRGLKTLQATMDEGEKLYKAAQDAVKDDWKDDQIKELRQQTLRLARNIERQHKSIDRLRWDLFSYCLQPNTTQASR